VKKFTNAIKQEMKKANVAGTKLGVDFIDINIAEGFRRGEDRSGPDGMTPMMEARAIKNEDEQEALRMVGAIGDAAHWEFMKFLQPGRTENQLTAHIMQYLYSVPGMEDVEERDRVPRPEHLAELAQFLRSHRQARRHRVHRISAALTWNGYKSCLLPHLLRGQGADQRAEGHLRDRASKFLAVRLDQGGEGRHDHAGDRIEMALGEGSLGLRRGGFRPRRTSGPRPRARSNTTSR